MGYPFNFSASHMLSNCLKIFIRRYASLEGEKSSYQWDLTSVNKYLMEWCREDGGSGVQGKDKRHKLKHRRFCLNYRHWEVD